MSGAIDAALLGDDLRRRSVDVLANDVDPAGGALIATPATDPSHGTVVVASDGGYTYTVDSNDAAMDGPPSNQHVVAAAVSTYEDGLRRIAFDRNEMPRGRK